MIDIGINLTNSRFDHDRQTVIEQAELANIQHMLITGTSENTSQQAIKLCQQYPTYLSSTVGVHPHDADSVSVNFIEKLNKLAASPFVKAIGECGLDFNRMFSSKENQQKVFEQQIVLASKQKLPLFLHQREAFDPWFALLSPYIGKIPAMISHCFTGNKQELKACLDADMYIGITGWLCDKKRGQELRDIVKYIPLERLLIETDAPFLTPQNISPKPKSSRNEPKYLIYIVQKLAELIGCDQQKIINCTTRNAKNVFQLP